MRHTPVSLSLLLFILLLGLSSASAAGTYSFIIQPILPAKKTEVAYAPLIAYLNEKTGHTFELETASNFLSYWQEMKKGKYDVVVDAAHLTDYRAQKMGYRPTAKVLNVVSFTLVTGEDVFAFEPSELVGKRIASLASPSRGALTLDAFFDNPVRQPILLEVTNAQEAIDKVLNKSAHGAIIPTPLAGANPQLNIVTTEEQWPHMALSVSPDVPEDVATALQTALLEASNSPKGQTMLEQINLPGFEKADSNLYRGYSDILKSFWGY